MIELVVFQTMLSINKFKSKIRSSRGFTLLEILLVVAAIAILAGIVILAINPAKQLADTRNAARKAAVREIKTAIEQYQIDHGHLPNRSDWVGTDTYTICQTGQDPNDCLGGIASENKLIKTAYADNATIFLSDLTDNGAYLTAMPVDPTSPDENTGYTVTKNSSGRVVVSAPLAENSWTIDSDGSDQSNPEDVTLISECGTVISNAGYYLLSTDLDCDGGNGVTVTAVTVHLDCNNHDITGSGTYGIQFNDVSNSTIINCNVTGYGEGIFINSGSSNTILDSTANSNGDNGIYLVNSTGNVIGPNVTMNSNSGAGIYLDHSDNNELTNVTANLNSNIGIYLYVSNSNDLNNIIANQNGNDGFVFQESGSNSLTDSTATDNGTYDIYNYTNSSYAQSTVSGNTCGENKCAQDGNNQNLCTATVAGVSDCK